MFERLLALFERAVVAYEKSVATQLGEPAHAIVVHTAKPTPVTESFNDTDREALLLRCDELGIAVPPRTKTLTLVKMITEKTAAVAAQTDSTLPEYTIAPDPATTPSGQETGAALSDDPFAVSPQDPGPVKEVSKEELLAAAQKFHTDHKQDNVLLAGIFFEHGKAAVFPKIDKQYYKAVYDALSNYTDADFTRYTQAGVPGK